LILIRGFGGFILLRSKVMNKGRLIIMLNLLLLTPLVSGQDYDANDFAEEMVSYQSGDGAGIYVDPYTALGRPSIDTDYLGSQRPVVPVFPQWLPTEIVTVGRGGHLILKFSQRVGDDENNPYGIDFIVFGNTLQLINSLNNWNYDDPCEADIETGIVNTEPAWISVSQDGVSWFTFENGPFGDSFAPTLGRIFDTNEPCDVYPGWNNLWWGQMTNPTIPLDPNLVPEDFEGVSLAEMCEVYGHSAGGTGFDINDLDPCDLAQITVDPNTGRRWIQYIKVESVATEPDDNLVPEIDAVSDVSGCGDYKHPFPAGDLSKNCRVDFEDVEIFSRYWLEEVSGLENAAIADIYEDEEMVVNFKDWAVLAQSWSECTWECNE
jgi:hypothetical protein